MIIWNSLRNPSLTFIAPYEQHATNNKTAAIRKTSRSIIYACLTKSSQCVCNKRIYSKVCPSICSSVTLSVSQPVRPSVWLFEWFICLGFCYSFCCCCYWCGCKMRIFFVFVFVCCWIALSSHLIISSLLLKSFVFGICGANSTKNVRLKIAWEAQEFSPTFFFGCDRSLLPLHLLCQVFCCFLAVMVATFPSKNGKQRRPSILGH